MIDKTQDDTELNRRVFEERVALSYRSMVLSVTAVVVNSLLIAYVLRTPANTQLVWGWCAATLVVAAYRCLVLVRFRAQSESAREEHSGYWYGQLLLGALLSGLTWGSAGYVLYDPSDMFNQSLLAFVIAGMCAGSIVSLSAFAEASMLFVSLSLFPFFLRLVTVGSAETQVMAAMVALYLGMMITFSRRVNQTVVTGLEMTYLQSRAEETIERQALFDDLTGLPNRRLLHDRLSQAHARVKRYGRHAALLFMDLDFFKRVNDSLGHGVGDQLLIEVSRRMNDQLREEDTAARLGGDEFVALLTDMEGDLDQVISAVRRRGEQLRKAIEAPVIIEGQEIHITVSIGVSLLDEHTGSVDDLLRHADTAMYRAKDDGRNTLRFFVAEMQEALTQRVIMERQLRVALDQGEGLKLHMQPQYDRNFHLVGAELLLRWETDAGFISPTEFIPVAEDSGLIYRLGDWVTEEACRISAALRAEFSLDAFSLAFNVSPRQFRQPGFSDKVLESLESYEVPSGTMEIEVTESLLIDEIESTVAKMERLRGSGLRFSIDDFGTGYSSLKYLKSLPLDTLKIDQSFVRDVLHDEGDASIVRAIISMSQSLGLQVIAEGVETEAVQDFLVNAGCDQFQGYLYAPPMSFEDFRSLLLDSNSIRVRLRD